MLAFGSTLGLNLLAYFTRPANICQAGPFAGAGWSLLAFGLFVLLAGAAGFLSGRGGASPSYGALAGLLTGAIAGLAMILLLPLAISSSQAIFHNLPTCAGGGSGAFQFQFGSPPPGFVVPTPPFETPPAGLVTPPPEFFRAMGTVGSIVGAATNIVVGIGIATGLGALGSVLGGSTRD